MGIENELLREAKRQISRHERHGRLLAEELRRRQRRSMTPQGALTLDRPKHWSLDPGFDPYVTRARANRIAHSIRQRVADRTYVPRSPVGFDVQKPGGGERQVCIYQVADGALSKMFFESVLKKNLPILSARAYAYRKDVSAQNAIQHVRAEFSGKNRLFVAEYDFSKYFDTIDHDHVRRVLADQFLLTEVERSAIEGFLTVAPKPWSDYGSAEMPTREVGIPQGTSISLFLANVAAWELDRDLDRTGVGFVRYADDTLLWSPDYGRICEAVEVLHAHAATIGVAVNASKSPGIRVLVPDNAEAEMQSTTSVDYLGYRLSLGRSAVKDQAIDRMKTRIDTLIYRGLLHEPLNGTQNLGRLAGNVDRDYVSVIWRIRRYLYGDLSQKAVMRFQRRDAPLRRFRGVMSAYPLIDDEDQLRAFDDWLLTKLYLALRRRAVLLAAPALPDPHGLDRNSLRMATSTSTSTGEQIDLAVPSARLVSNVIRAAAAAHGPSLVGVDPYNY